LLTRSSVVVGAADLPLALCSAQTDSDESADPARELADVAPERMTVRYIVSAVDQAIAFYTTKLGFAVIMHSAPAFAVLSRGDFRLLLSAASSHGGGQILARDRRPEPGGWKRFQLEVETSSRRCIGSEVQASPSVAT
jgi:hypothetical protein